MMHVRVSRGPSDNTVRELLLLCVGWNANDFGDLLADFDLLGNIVTETALQFINIRRFAIADAELYQEAFANLSGLGSTGYYVQMLDLRVLSSPMRTWA
jgi:hypothetical protein